MSIGASAVVGSLVVAASLIGAILVPTVLSASSRSAPRGRASVPTVVVATAVGLTAWYAIANAIAVAGGFRGDGIASARFPVIGYGVGMPVALGLAALVTVTPLRQLVIAAEIQPALIAVQSYRLIAGAVFLALMLMNQLPAIFAIPAGGGDFLVGLFAFGIARSVRAGRRRPAVIWNLLGMLDLVVAVGLGVTTSPGPAHLIFTTPTTIALSIPPLVVVPTFLVPMSFLLHVVSLRFLWVTRATEAQATKAAVV